MRSVLALLIAVTVLTAPAWALRPNPDNNPTGADILLWHMDDATGSIWTDTAWYGSMNGTGAATSVPGLFLSPLMPGLGAAGGMPDAGIVSPAFASNQGQSFTVECWVMWPTGTNPQAANQLLFERRSPTDMWYAKVNVMGTGGTADTVEFAAWVAGGTGGAVNSGPCNFVNNQWYHIAITCENFGLNDNTIKIYVTPAPAPGVPITAPVLKTTVTGYGDMPATAATALKVGGGMTGGMAGRNFDGYMDEVRYTDAVLTSFDSFLPGVSPNTATVPWGDTQQFYYDTAATPVTWEVINQMPDSLNRDQVGSIDSNGLFTALGPGTCQIQATDANYVVSESGTITVPVPVVAPDTVTLAPKGTQAFTFDSMATPITWQVVNESTPGVGTIGSSGVFTAVAAGTCQIRATDGYGYTDDSGTITVQNLTITPASAQVVRWGKVQFTCYPFNEPVTWSVINQSPAGSVGSIDPATGLFTSLGSLGTCEVQAVDITGNTATAAVNVIAPGAHDYAADANTVALYHLDEVMGTRYDSSGNGLNLSPINPVGSVTGVLGNAAGPFNYLDTTTTYGLLSAGTPLLNGDKFTIEAWVYFPPDVDILAATTGVVPAPIVSYRNLTNHWEFVAGVYSSPNGVPGGLTLVYWGKPANEFVYTTDRVFYNDIWYHVAATVEKLDADMYQVNLYCTPLGTTTPQPVATATTANAPIMQGNDYIYVGGYGPTRKFPGYVDEVRFSNKVRSADEMGWTLGGVTSTPYTIGEAKRDIADGTTVSLTGAVSANLPGCSYLEAVDRSAGIKLDSKQTLLMAPGDVETVTGTLARTSDGERYLQPLHAEKTAALVPPLGPLGISMKSAGGGVFGLQPGATVGTGLNTFGQLVRLCGNWVSSGTDTKGAYFDLDDGSAVPGADGAVGVRVYYSGTIDPTSRSVAVTGILIPVMDGSMNVVAALLPTAEIQLMN